MRKTFIGIIKTLAGIMTFFIFLSSGCGDNDKYNVGYHSIHIPLFGESDYLLMLNSTNEEIQYNAICNLTVQKDYDKVLTTDSLKGTPSYDTALLLYNKVFSLMYSKDDWVSSAAIRFFGDFEYKRDTFVQSVLTNNKASLNVQLAIIMNLEGDTVKDQRLLNQKLRFLQKQRSWLLQNGSYLLIGKNDSVPLNEYMERYKQSPEEYKKLLIMDVLTSHITDSVFSFLTNEWAMTRNRRIKEMIFSQLPKAHNEQLVLGWFNEHFNLLTENMKDMISHVSDREYGDIYSKLIVMALEKGWKPSSLLMDKNEQEYYGEPVLYIYLFADKYDEYARDSIKLKQSLACKRVEGALFQNAELKKEWLASEDRFLKRLKPAMSRDLINKHRQLTEEYLKQTRLLLQRQEIDSALYNNFKEKVKEETNALYEERTGKH